VRNGADIRNPRSPAWSRASWVSPNAASASFA